MSLKAYLWLHSGVPGMARQQNGWSAAQAGDGAAQDVLQALPAVLTAEHTGVTQVVASLSTDAASFTLAAVNGSGVNAAGAAGTSGSGGGGGGGAFSVVPFRCLRAVDEHAKDKSGAQLPFLFSVRSTFGRAMLQAATGFEYVEWLSGLRNAVPLLKPLPDAHCRLIAALTTDRADDVRRLLRDHPELLEARDGGGSTPLLLAARFGSIEALQLLLRRDALVDAENTTRLTPVIVAAAGGHVACVDSLLRKFRRVHGGKAGKSRSDKLKSLYQSQDKMSLHLDHAAAGGFTAAHGAAAGGHHDILEMLMLEGANPCIVDANGWTVAHYAAMCPQGSKCVGLLCDVAVDLIEVWDLAGNTPLHVAAGYGWVDGVQMLLQSAANPHSINLHGWSALHVAQAGGHYDCESWLTSYNDSKGLAPAPVAKKRSATSMDRIMAIWERFFNNALTGALEGDSKSEVVVVATPRDKFAAAMNRRIESYVGGADTPRSHRHRNNQTPPSQSYEHEYQYEWDAQADDVTAATFHNAAYADYGVNPTASDWSFAPYVEADIPAGWSVIVGADGRSYYYHEASQYAQWDKPTGPPPAPLAPAPDLDLDLGPTAEYHVATTQQEDRDAGQWEWQHFYTDEGVPYYYNPYTQQSVWADSIAFAPVSLADPAPQQWQDVPAGVPLSEAGSADENPYVNNGGWAVLADDQGNQYWHNADTGVSQWV